MAFLVVLREGFEISVFVLALDRRHDQRARSRGRAARPRGSLVAVVIGVAVVRGGLRLDMARFFRITAFVLVAQRRGARHDSGARRQRRRMAGLRPDTAIRLVADWLLRAPSARPS